MRVEVFSELVVMHTYRGVYRLEPQISCTIWTRAVTMYTSVIVLILALFSQSEGEKIILLFPVILSAYIISYYIL